MGRRERALRRVVGDVRAAKGRLARETMAKGERVVGGKVPMWRMGLELGAVVSIIYIVRKEGRDRRVVEREGAGEGLDRGFYEGEELEVAVAVVVVSMAVEEVGEGVRIDTTSGGWERS